MMLEAKNVHKFFNGQEVLRVIEGIAADVIDELIGQELTKANCGDLEKHAYSVNDGIAVRASPTPCRRRTKSRSPSCAGRRPSYFRTITFS